MKNVTAYPKLNEISPGMIASLFEVEIVNAYTGKVDVTKLELHDQRNNIPSTNWGSTSQEVYYRKVGDVIVDAYHGNATFDFTLVE